VVVVLTTDSSSKIAGLDIKSFVAELTDKFAEVTGIRAPAVPFIEFGNCGGADALLISSKLIMLDESLIGNPASLKKIMAHEVAHSVLFQCGIDAKIDDVYSVSFKEKMGIGFKNSTRVIDNLPALLIIRGLEEAPAHQFTALCGSEGSSAKAGYGNTMYALRLYTMRSSGIVSDVADNLSKTLLGNDILDAKSLLEGEWARALYDAFCRSAVAYNEANPGSMSVDYMIGYYGRIFALSDAIRFGYDHKMALNHEIKTLQELTKRISAYVDNPDTWVGWLR
jgi:hypothetical protein